MKYVLDIRQRAFAGLIAGLTGLCALGMTMPSHAQAIAGGGDDFESIIGGEDSLPETWPSAVALVQTGFGTAGDRQFCGGNLIASRWVLTAAHCLYDTFGPISAARVRVVAGVKNLFTGVSPGSEIIVTNIFRHPEYNNQQAFSDADLALLELATAAETTSSPLFTGDSDRLAGATAHIVGWGLTRFPDPSNASRPDVQQQASVPLVSRAECNEPRSYDGMITERQLCAGFREGGVDSCRGDSGGPLFIERFGRIEQIGVTSFGRGCAEADFFGIYTSVASFKPWIEQYVSGGELVANSDPDDGGQGFQPRVPPLENGGPGTDSEQEPIGGQGQTGDDAVTPRSGGGASGLLILSLLMLTRLLRGRRG